MKGWHSHIYIAIAKYIYIYIYASYFKNHDLIDFGGKNNPNSRGMLESNVPGLSLHIFMAMKIIRDLE
jgi:hypothetical protein